MATLVPDDEPTRTLVPDEPAPARTWGDTLRNIRDSTPSTESIVRGIPIVGPAITKGFNYAAAAPEAWIKGVPVSEVYAREEAERQKTREAHPIANTIGEVAGSLMTAVPAARAFPALFGGSTMPGQMAAGAGIGGADAAVRSGGDLDEIKKGLAIGGVAPVMGSVLAPVGQGIASGTRWLADKTPGVKSVFARSVAVPEAQAVLDDASRGFQSLAGQMTYTPYSLDTLTAAIKQGLRGRNVSNKVGAVEAHNILDTLSSLPPNPGSLHTIRKKLGEVSGSGDEIASAKYARELIDKFLENPTQNTVVTQGGQQASNVLKTLQEANANWQAGQTSKALRDEVNRAVQEAQTANKLAPILVEGQIVRRNLNNYLKNKTKTQYMLPDQREAIANAITSQSLGEGILDTIGKVSQTQRPGMGTWAPILTGGAWASGAANPWLVAGGLAAGAGANAASTGLTRRAVEHADKLIRARSPFGQAAVNAQRQPPISLTPAFNPRLHSSLSPIAHRNEIARLLALQAEREAVKE